VLVGRDAECGRIDGLIEAARAGRSGVLVLRGEIGTGKSALLGYASERADELTLLATRPVESEAELPFAGLADLLRPLLSHLDALPAPQVAALAGALAIGPPVEGDRFAVCAATLGLLATAADERPLLVLVDSAQWLDRSSLQALVFAARRLESEAVAVLFAVRDGVSTALDGLGFDEIRLGRLDDDAARALVGDDARLLELAAGNPLALVELPHVAEVPAAEQRGASALEHAFEAALDTLPDDARRLLVVAAASQTGDTSAVLAAAEALGIDPESLGAVEEAGLVAVDGDHLGFRHPLLRMTAYRSAAATVRRDAHRALAQGDSDDGRAWHLAAAADDTAADALVDAGRRARLRGGHAEAAAAFERAAGLGAAGADRASRLRAAAEEMWLAGRVERAGELLEDALAEVPDEPTRARIQHLRGAIDMWHAAPASARALLADEAVAVEELDPARAARMLTDAAWASFMAGDIDTGRGLAERAGAVGRRAGGDAEVLAGAALGIALVLGGEQQRAIPLLADYASASTLSSRPLRPDGQVLTWFERYDDAREVLTATVDGARAASALAALPYALACLADVDFRTGRWVAGRVGAAEAVRVADETEQASTLAFALSCLSRFDAAQGRPEECVAHARRAQAIGDQRFGAVVAFALAALGLLELGLGRPHESAVHLELLERQVAERGLREPGVVQWQPDLVEALVRGGRESDALRALDDLERAAGLSERAWALAAAARCRGLLAADNAFEAEFEVALELHSATPTPFERARTELCLGERLRRARRRADAREPLLAALDAFDRLGAAPWADRARGELQACGETMHRAAPVGLEELTPQELQVALIVARGASNKEAGAALFLSPKTIETHLGRVYRKLGVRTRTELAALLARNESLMA
jgi:DNA-binding CsgD family transcriptional regulator